MQATASASHLFGRRLAGSFLYALLVSAVALPVTVWLAGLAIGPQELREQIVVTVGRFAAFHGRDGLFMVMAATVLGLTALNLAVGPRRRYALNWGLGPILFDDTVGARKKLAAVLASWHGRILLGLVLLWIVLAFFEGG